jgi:hypothetical protein
VANVKASKPVEDERMQKEVLRLYGSMHEFIDLVLNSPEKDFECLYDTAYSAY